MPFFSQRSLASAYALLVAALSSGCGAGEGGIPDSIRAIAQHHEVERFSGWSLPGVTLYRLSFSVPDHSSSSVVGLDDSTGAVLRGPALMRRVDAQAPDVLASRAFDALLGQQGGRAVTPSDRGELGTDEHWALVRPPRIEGDTLVFFGWRGEMAPELVEHRVSVRTWEVTTRSVAEVIVAEGRRAAIGGPQCLPSSACGCWTGCAEYQLVQVPGRSRDESLYVLVGEEDGALYTARPSCTRVSGRETCARACRADSPDAACDDAVVPESETCTGSCVPSEAFFHCDRYDDGCRRVDHPIRRAAAQR